MKFSVNRLFLSVKVIYQHPNDTQFVATFPLLINYI